MTKRNISSFGRINKKGKMGQKEISVIFHKNMMVRKNVISTVHDRGEAHLRKRKWFIFYLKKGKKPESLGKEGKSKGCSL